MSNEAEVKRWYIEIFPVIPGPGPGDGSDAAYASSHFIGTRRAVEEEAERLRKEQEERLRSADGYGPDNTEVGCLVRESPLPTKP
jgi:hypothetical protein